VREHESFDVNIIARAKDGSEATHFIGDVDLSFRLPDGTRWADVRPSHFVLFGGHAIQPVTLNRETIPPQAPRLIVNAGDTHGSSGETHVLAPTLVPDATPVVSGAFGWATATTYSAVVHDGTQFRMYYVGDKSAGGNAVGLATSPDGRTFTPVAQPVFPAP